MLHDHQMITGRLFKALPEALTLFPHWSQDIMSSSPGRLRRFPQSEQKSSEPIRSERPVAADMQSDDDFGNLSFSNLTEMARLVLEIVT